MRSLTVEVRSFHFRARLLREAGSHARALECGDVALTTDKQVNAFAVCCNGEALIGSGRLRSGDLLGMRGQNRLIARSRTARIPEGHFDGFGRSTAAAR